MATVSIFPALGSDGVRYRVYAFLPYDEPGTGDDHVPGAVFRGNGKLLRRVCKGVYEVIETKVVLHAQAGAV